MTVWNALYPYPAADGGSQVFTFFMLVVLLGALGGFQELLLLIRAERAMWVARSLAKRETTRSRRQVEEVANQLSDASPALAPAARAMLDATAETRESVRLTRSARDLFQADALRQPQGAVFLPLSFLAAAPALLVSIGLLGACVSGIGALQSPTATLEAAFGVGLVSAAWGFLGGGLLLALGRYSQGRAESAVGSIVAWADQQLGVGSASRGVIDRVLRSASQQSSQTLAALLEHQRESSTAQQQALSVLTEAIQTQQPIAVAPASAPASAPVAAPAITAQVERTAVTATVDPEVLEALVARLSSSVSDAVAASIRSAAPAAAPAPALAPTPSPDAPRGLFDDPFPPANEPPGLFDAPAAFPPAASAPAAAAPEPAWLESVADRMVEGVRDAVAGLSLQAAAGGGPSAAVAASMDDARSAMTSLVEQMRAVSAEMQRSARRIGDASAPVSTAATSFLTASERIQGVLPDIGAAAEAYNQARGALDQSAEVLQAGMSGYAQASHTLQEMVRDLRDSHTAYRSHQEGWDESIGGVRRLVKDLGAVSLEIRQGASQLNAVVQPAASAADAFKAASEQLGEVLPGIQGAAESYARAQGALDQSSQVLREGTSAYVQTGASVQAMVADLQKTQADQQCAGSAWRDELAAVSGTVRELRAAAETLSAAADASATVAQRGADGAEQAIQAAASRAAETLDAAAVSVAEVLATSTAGVQSAIAPAATASNAFLQAADRLQRVLPRMEGAAQAYINSREALDSASITIQQSTAGYREAGEVVRGMLSEMKDSHTEAVRRIRDGVDEALLESMREAGGQLATFNQHQQSNVALWDGATGRLRGVLDTLRETADHLSSVAGSVEATTGPTVDAAQAFQRAAASLNEAMPRIEATTRSQTQIQQSLEAASETLETGMKGYQAVVSTAAATLAAGTKGYQEAGEAVERMVTSLEAQHAAALQGAVDNLASSFQEPLSEASSRLAEISREQAAALVAWQATVSDLQVTAGALASGSSDATALVSLFKEAADPAAEAASSFREAAVRLTSLFPRLEESADGYERINQALASAAGELTQSSTQYHKAGEQMTSLTRELQKTLKFQVLGTQKFAESMDRAAGFVQAIGPASERVERAADGLRSASERTAEVVHTIQASVSTQDEAMMNMRTTAEMVLQAMQRQSGHWGNFLGELDRLQGTLNSSVDALTTKLPHSIDHTLVHFDAALAEGVARLGGSVERLREVMDDLQERLELLMADTGRRR